jgi:hypothetical protein
LEQDGVPVKVQELLLAACEPTNIDALGSFDSHSTEGGQVGDRRDYEFAVIFEANEPPIKKMIDAWPTLDAFQAQHVRNGAASA